MRSWLAQQWFNHEMTWKWQTLRCRLLGHRIRVGGGFAVCQRKGCGWYEELPEVRFARAQAHVHTAIHDGTVTIKEFRELGEAYGEHVRASVRQ